MIKRGGGFSSNLGFSMTISTMRLIGNTGYFTL
jgi:hypothetical protein